MVFAIHWHESSTGVHVSPILNFPPTSLPSYPSGSSQCTSPEHPVSCIEPGLAICFTYDNIHVSVLFTQSSSCKFQVHWVQKHIECLRQAEPKQGKGIQNDSIYIAFKNRQNCNVRWNLCRLFFSSVFIIILSLFIFGCPGLRCCVGLLWVVTQEGDSMVVLHRLLIAGASLVEAVRL